MAMSLEQAYNKHNNHDMKIIWKDIKDQPYWRKPALVCIDCNKQIQWLSTDIVVDLVNEFKIPEENKLPRPLTWAERTGRSK